MRDQDLIDLARKNAKRMHEAKICLDRTEEELMFILFPHMKLKVFLLKSLGEEVTLERLEKESQEATNYAIAEERKRMALRN